jgi:hypothetical protein
MIETTATLHRNENPDSIEIGTPSKGGAIKVYGDFFNPEVFKQKIDNAILIKDYCNKKMERAIL